MSYSRALAAETTIRHDYITAYVNDLANVIDFDALSGTALKLAVDPLGGAGVAYWPRIAEQYKLPLEVLNLEALHVQYETLTPTGRQAEQEITIPLQTEVDLGYRIPLKVRELIPAAAGVIQGTIRGSPVAS